MLRFRSALPLVVLGVSLSSFSAVQAAPEPRARVQYKAINDSLKSYRHIERDLMGLSLEGGSMTAYYQGKQIQKIVARFYGESGRNIEEYYFWRGQLFFFYKVRQDYTKLFSGKVARQSETRAYFENGKLVKLLADKTPQSLTTPQALELAKRVKTDVRFYLDVASKPNTKDERKYPG